MQLPRFFSGSINARCKHKLQLWVLYSAEGISHELTINPLGFWVVDLKLRLEQILYGQLGVTPSLVVNCKTKPWIITSKSQM